MKYALEGKSNGGPNGQFYMTKNAMEAVTDEVVDTHLNFKGAKKEQYVQEKMKELWPRYDVNEDGFIDVQRAPVFLR